MRGAKKKRASGHDHSFNHDAPPFRTKHKPFSLQVAVLQRLLRQALVVQQYKLWRAGLPDGGKALRE